MHVCAMTSTQEIGFINSQPSLAECMTYTPGQLSAFHVPKNNLINSARSKAMNQSEMSYRGEAMVAFSSPQHRPIVVDNPVASEPSYASNHSSVNLQHQQFRTSRDSYKHMPDESQTGELNTVNRSGVYIDNINTSSSRLYNDVVSKRQTRDFATMYEAKEPHTVASHNMTKFGNTSNNLPPEANGNFAQSLPKYPWMKEKKQTKRSSESKSKFCICMI